MTRAVTWFFFECYGDPLELHALNPSFPARRSSDRRDQVAVAGGKLPGEARAGWRVLRALGEGLGIDGFDFTDLAGLRAGLAPRTVEVARSSAPTDRRGARTRRLRDRKSTRLNSSH